MKIGVIGAGIVGVAAALALAGRGHRVTLLERDAVAAGASRGNAGAFAFADVIPLATPGIMRKAPRWLIDPNGPLSIPPAHFFRIAPWLLAFWRASLRDRYRAAVEAQGALMKLSSAALERLVARHRLEALLRREGQLQLYETADEFRESLPGWAERRAAGVRFELLESTGAIAEIQPGIAPRFTHAGYTPDWINVVDPELWTQRLAEDFVRSGGQIERAEICDLAPSENGVRLAGPAGEWRFDRVVVAAGAFSGRLTAQLGLNLPLETERGYNTTLPAGAFDLRTHVTFSGHGFVVSRIGDGIRVGGGVELGGLDLPPRMERAASLLRKAASFLPGLDTRGGTQWMGFRPSMPDSLPVIGAASHPSVVLAFGHGHLGLTQSAGTAELIADIVDSRPPSIDIAPYRASRFSRVQK
ncbi:FAD-dependent oxidoreductase [Pseudaminobacter arsenicus]|uniref:FAD-dependent oxidoreductase n=1 Tax=Borborobacter arsenicus TaxID=1851146 RepID=A0A432UZN8_9HYPH|nr:FAD-dependent oxidoreductase [Pseudaminobacter arsenicus]RUM95399.1 FAD-dependent oxidoreductase [Pseudaminobacter arsenicus]